MKRAITGQTYEKGGVWDPCIEIWHQLLKDLGWRATGVLLKAVGIRNVVNFSQIKKWSIFSLDIVEPGGVFSTYICVIGSHWPPAEWFNICETRCFRGDRGNVTFCGSEMAPFSFSCDHSGLPSLHWNQRAKLSSQAIWQVNEDESRAQVIFLSTTWSSVFLICLQTKPFLDF